MFQPALLLVRTVDVPSNPKQADSGERTVSYEFQVDCILQDGVVWGRNSRGNVPLGTVFTTLAKSRLEADLPKLVDLGSLSCVDLRLAEVQWYRRSIDHVPCGHTAGLRLEGTGLEAIAEALAAKQTGESILLRS